MNIFETINFGQLKNYFWIVSDFFFFETNSFN